LKTGIPEFLPEHKQKELKQIIELIEIQFKKVDMVILYGSYARDNWVEDTYVENGITYEYMSDYDLLFVMNTEKKAKTIPFQSSIENAINALKIETPIGFIYHGYPYIVKMLEERRYFFCDIYKEGYILINRKNYEFEEPKDITY
jgi:predicted nucleotidyltransferase